MTIRIEIVIVLLLLIECKLSPRSPIEPSSIPNISVSPRLCLEFSKKIEMLEAQNDSASEVSS